MRELFTRLLRLMVVGIFAIGMITGCADDDDDDNNDDDNDIAADDDDDTDLPPVGGFAADFEASGDFFTNMTDYVNTGGPHDDVQIFYSENLTDVIVLNSFTAPVGATAIKKNDEDGDKQVDSYTVMVKREAGYDTANGDWYYEVRDAAGEVVTDPAPGKIGMCINCHKNYLATDYLAGTKITD